MAHVLEHLGGDARPFTADGLDLVALEDRIAEARNRRARALAARQHAVPSAPSLGAAPTRPARTRSTRRTRHPLALALPVFVVGLAAGATAVVFGPSLVGPPPSPPPVVLTTAALVPPPATQAAPQPRALAPAATPGLAGLAPLDLAPRASRPAPRPAAGLRPAPSRSAARSAAPSSFLLDLAAVAPPSPIPAAGGFDPGHLARSLRVAFPTASKPPVLTPQAEWPLGAQRPTAGTRSAGHRPVEAPSTRTQTPITALFQAIGRLARQRSN